MADILELIGREKNLFDEDILANKELLYAIVASSTFLVIGGAGAIGQSVVKEIFSRNPKKLHVVDISENNLVELVRDIRSSYGYIDGDFRTFAIDVASVEYDAFINSYGEYDYVLNLSALKHVRSEKDPFTLMRMIDVNIFNTDKTILHSIKNNTKKYFCVSTDKAANPVNMMGASKRIMEMFLAKRSSDIAISTARFANVAFSDGSLLHGFDQRIKKVQPIAAPNDVTRYFVTKKEAGQLCLLSCLLGDNGEIFFPKLSKELNLVKFSDIAIKYLENLGYEPYLCDSEDEARDRAEELVKQKKWPCYFFQSDTTGEKSFEEFYTDNEEVNLDKFNNIGIVNNSSDFNIELLNKFESEIKSMKSSLAWEKKDIVNLFSALLPNFYHQEMGKFLDEKM